MPLRAPALALVALLTLSPAKAEVRALWADCWGEGFLTPAQTDQFLRDAWNTGYNTLIVEVRKTGDAYYRSQLEPRGANLARDYDPLADVLKRAKQPPTGKTPLEVHAWIVVNRVWVGPKDPPAGQPAHLLTAHPDWLMKNEKGERIGAENHMYQDPAHPGVVEHTAALVRELVGGYELDGLHLDYIRYPGREWGYSPTALRRFAAQGGSPRPAPADPDWMAWRRRQNDLLVRRIAAEALALRPTLKLSASVVTWGGTHGGNFEATDAFARALQNWPLWCAMGWMDQIYLMNYKRENNARHASDYRDWIELGQRLAGGAELISGQAAYLNPPAASLAQLAAARERGAGLCTYSYRALCNDSTPRAEVLRRFAPLLARGKPASAATPPPRHLLMGRVLDAEGRGVDGATVVAEAGGKRRETLTDATGFYAFLDLPEGAAQLVAEMGARRSGRGPASLLANRPARLDLRLP